jgi:hypothetical protein
MTEPPIPPRRWREDASLRPPGGDAVLRGARPRAPSARELARLGAAVGHIGRIPQPGWHPGWKLALAAAGTAAVVAGGTFVLRAERQPPPAPQISSPPPALPAARADEEVAIAPPAEAPAPVIAPAPDRPAARTPSTHARLRSRPAHATAAAVAADQLQRETRLIDAARAALAASPGRALAVLEDHRREFPSGQLAAEREFLAVEALRRMGRSDEARRRADALIARWASSPYAARARRVLASTPARATEPDRGGTADMP